MAEGKTEGDRKDSERRRPEPAWRKAALPVFVHLPFDAAKHEDFLRAPPPDTLRLVERQNNAEEERVSVRGGAETEEKQGHTKKHSNRGPDTGEHEHIHPQITVITSVHVGGWGGPQKDGDQTEEC